MPELEAFLSANWPLKVIRTHEIARTVRVLASALGRFYKTVITWDCVRGLPGDTSPATPVQAIKQARSKETAVIAPLFHRFWDSAPVIQNILNELRTIYRERSSLIAVVPYDAVVPPELRRTVAVYEWPLPDYRELYEVLTALPDVSRETKQRLARAGLGLTLSEFASLVQQGVLDPKAMTKVKLKLLSGNTALSVIEPEFGFDKLGGLYALKSFLKKAAVSSHARGCLLLGVPGTGKTAVAVALGRETNRPVVSLDVGAAFSSLVGASEQRIREALATVERLGECILLIDEIEKALSGVKSSTFSDAGTAARVFRTVLTWLSERKPSGVYVVATCNDVSALPPELLRSERWDTIFFLDLPRFEQRQEIWRIWLEHYQVEGEGPDPEDPSPWDEGWTGADIRTCCRLASILECEPRAAKAYVKPVSLVYEEQIDQLREWARKRCVVVS